MNIVLLIADDLNDKIGCYGGPVRTPNINKFSNSAVRFDNVSCPVSLCNPSRFSLLSGMHPWKSGIYNNTQFFRDYDHLKDVVTLPQFFKKKEFKALSAGKIFHNFNGKLSDPVSWDMVSPMGPAAGTPINWRSHGFHDLIEKAYFRIAFDFSPTVQRFKDMNDAKNADWVCKRIGETDGPFFAAYGSFMPHLPWYIPQYFFDLYDIDKIELPEFAAKQYWDSGGQAKNIIASTRLNPLFQKFGKMKEVLRGYYAAASFADACFGKVIDFINNSEYRDNTIVVLTSDHGWHLGERQAWSKFKPWERAVRVPMLIRVPGMEPGVCEYPASLTDIYPTILSLMGLEAPHELDGEDLVPFMKDFGRDDDRVVISSSAYGGYWSLRNRSHRFIQFSNGSTELYDMIDDPNESNNISGSRPDLVKMFLEHLPRDFARFEPV